MRGIDISHHNGRPLSAIAEKGYQESDFVVVKATQGLSYSATDFFKWAMDRTLKDGKLAGAYHYAKGYNPESEADYFLSIVKPYLGRIILALDWETSELAAGVNYAWGSTTWAKRFVDRIREKTGLICLLYTGQSGCLQCANLAGAVPLWFAGYPTSANTWNVPAWPSWYRLGSFGSRPDIWQFTNSQNKLDRNTTNWTKADWQKYTKAVKVSEVMVGSARIDENGNAAGGKAGDQTGREVCEEPYYTHGLGWVGLRAKNKEVARKIAYAMQRACDNPKIGYDQYQRGTLYSQASLVGFDPGKVAVACETDCSALVRVCLAYAGIHVNDFNTTNEKAVILGTGKFIEFAPAKTIVQPGDILVTKTKGHTVIVVSGNEPEPEPSLEGEEMQGLIKDPNANKIYYYNIEAKEMWWVPNPDCLALLKSEYKRAYGKDLVYMDSSKFATLKKLIQGKSV